VTDVAVSLEYYRADKAHRVPASPYLNREQLVLERPCVQTPLLWVSREKLG